MRQKSKINIFLLSMLVKLSSLSLHLHHMSGALHIMSGYILCHVLRSDPLLQISLSSTLGCSSLANQEISQIFMRHWLWRLLHLTILKSRKLDIHVNMIQVFRWQRIPQKLQYYYIHQCGRYGRRGIRPRLTTLPTQIAWGFWPHYTQIFVVPVDLCVGKKELVVEIRGKLIITDFWFLIFCHGLAPSGLGTQEADENTPQFAGSGGFGYEWNSNMVWIRKIIERYYLHWFCI